MRRIQFCIWTSLTIISLFITAGELNAVPFSTIIPGTIPKGFAGIDLGMSLEETQNELELSTLVDYNSDPVVSLLAEPNRTLIQCRGTSYIKQALFQFNEEKLYIITLILNENQMDYYSLYSDFTEKYGITTNINPNGAIWEDESVQLHLEKPLIVKYVDRVVFQQLQEEEQILNDLEKISREDFIELF